MPLTLYKLSLCPPSRACLMTAELLKLDIETKDINCRLDEQLKPEFIEKNPLHTIPLLEDGDFLLSDSHAINTYLVSKYGGEKQGKLYPEGLAVRATIDQRLFFDATTLFTPCKDMLVGIVRERAPGPTEKQIVATNEGYAVLEKYLEKTEYVACEHLTIADVSIVSTVSSLDAMVPIDEKFVKVHAWFNKLKNKEWYQKANVPGLNIMKLALAENSEFK